MLEHLYAYNIVRSARPEGKKCDCLQESHLVFLIAEIKEQFGSKVESIASFFARLKPQWREFSERAEAACHAADCMEHGKRQSPILKTLQKVWKNDYRVQRIESFDKRRYENFQAFHGRC